MYRIPNSDDTEATIFTLIHERKCLFKHQTTAEMERSWGIPHRWQEFHMDTSISNSSASGKCLWQNKCLVFKCSNRRFPMPSSMDFPPSRYNERVTESSAPTTHTSPLLLWDLICKNCALLCHKTEIILISVGFYQTCCTYQLFDTKIKEKYSK